MNMKKRALKQGRDVSFIGLCRTPAGRVMTAFLFVALLAAAAKAYTGQDKAHAVGTAVRWYPPLDVMRNIYHESILQTPALKHAYDVSVQGTSASEAIANSQKALQVCKNYVSAGHGDKNGMIEAYTIIAYCHFNIGEFQTNEADRIKSYEAARDAAQKLIDVAPGIWDGYIWYAAALGRMGQIQGVMKSLFLLEPLKKHLFQAEKICPGNPFVLDAIGDMYRQLPWIAGGSMSKAREYLEKAVQADPNFTLGRLDLAITLLEDGQKDKARVLLNEVVDTQTPSWRAHWLIWERPKAEALLSNMDNYKDLLKQWYLLI